MPVKKDSGFHGADEDTVRKVFLKTALRTFVLTLLWIPVFLFRCLLVLFIRKYKPSYGKPLDYVDSTVEEVYSNSVPKIVLAFTLVLDGPLELQELRQLFTRNVLEAKILNKKTGQDELRYPEFKQYQVEIAGYKFWKNDYVFNIANHITELPFSKDFQSASKIHRDMLCQKFHQMRSPWEMILVRNYQNKPDKTLIAYRCHHTLGDTKSNLKMLVEGLGQKELKLPTARFSKQTLWDKIHYYAWMPYYFLYVQVRGHFTELKGDKCHYKFKQEVEPLLNLAISKHISITDIKAIAKKHGVTGSAVIMAAVSGGVAKSDKRLAKTDIPIQWVLPKEDHPDKLANWHYSAVMDLPTNITSPLERLQKCNEIFLHLKSSKLHKYEKSVAYQIAHWFNPLRTKMMRNTTFPLIVTNIASDGEGFQVGSSPCSELSMTCAPMPGACGVAVCAFSYKDSLELATITKDGILSEAQANKLVELMQKEFEVLKRAAK